MISITADERSHTTPCLWAIVSALELSPLRPSQPFEFASSSFMLFWRISICSLQVLIKVVTCMNLKQCQHWGINYLLSEGTQFHYLEEKKKKTICCILIWTISVDSCINTKHDFHKQTETQIVLLLNLQ